MVTKWKNNLTNLNSNPSLLNSWNSEINELIYERLKKTYMQLISKLPFTKELTQLRYFDASALSIPEKTKRNGGEDSYEYGENFLLVLDGVGSWSQEGIDPSIFPKQLGKEIIKSVNSSDFKKQTLRDTLVQSFNKLKDVKGSCTVAMLYLKPDSTLLNTLFMGDSGYAIFSLRKNVLKLIIKSSEQQRKFNCPYQLGNDSDSPYESLEFNHFVKDNDLIVLATDGFWDNISIEEVRFFLETQINKTTGNLEDIALTTEILSYKARNNSYNKKYKSPFSIKAEENGFLYEGGKPDDITLIIAQVKSQIKDIKYSFWDSFFL